MAYRSVGALIIRIRLWAGGGGGIIVEIYRWLYRNMMSNFYKAGELSHALAPDSVGNTNKISHDHT